MRQSSTGSNWRVDAWIVIAVAALVAVFFYLVVSVLTFGIGFPLDDSWIHLTYARNAGAR
jgi:lipoprotein signal peptidase